MVSADRRNVFLKLSYQYEESEKREFYRELADHSRYDLWH